MSVDSTSDTSPKKNTLNGSVYTDGDSFHSYESDDSSPAKVLTSPSTGSDTSSPGTPRVIRRVGPITAVYAPDKHAREASIERMSSPVPSSAVSSNEREIVISSPTAGNSITALGTTFSTEFYTPRQMSFAEEDDCSDRELSSESGLNLSGPINSTTEETVLAGYTSINQQEHILDAPVNLEPDLSGELPGRSMDSKNSEYPVFLTDIVDQPDAHGDISRMKTSPAVIPAYVAPVNASIPPEQSDEAASLLESSSPPEKTAPTVLSVGKTPSNTGGLIGADLEQSAFRTVTHRTEVSAGTLESGEQDIVTIDQVAEASAVPFSDLAVISIPQPTRNDIHPVTYSTVPLLSVAQEIEEVNANGDSAFRTSTSPSPQWIAVKESIPAVSGSDLRCTKSTDSLQTAEQVQVIPAQTSQALPPDLISMAHRVSTEPDAELQTVLDLTERISSPVVLVRSDPAGRASYSRYSPAQLVAATGGASPEIVRNIETGTNDDDEGPSGASNAAEVATIPTRTSSRGGSAFSRRRMSAPDDDSITPITIPAIDLQVKVDAKLDPSTPEEVDKSSKLVFGNFVAERYKLEVSASATASVHGTRISSANAAASINIPVPSTSHESSNEQRFAEDDLFGADLASIPRSNPDSMEMAVARNLAQIGDEINRRYGPRLDRMIKLLPVNECPMESFSRVARALFSRGPTNWGQIVTLFYFGYRLVIRRVRSDVAKAFRQVYDCLITFCRQLNIFRWIAEQGGWLILKYLRLVKPMDNGEESVTAPSASVAISDPHDGMQASSNALNTVFFVSSAVAAACVALFVYRRLYTM